MGWTAPKTWVYTELVTDTILNLHVRDNLNACSRVIEEVTDSGGLGNLAGTFTQVWFYHLPAGTVASDGDHLVLTAHGFWASNGNNKRVQAYFHSNPIADSGVVTSSGTGWSIHAEVRRMSPTVVLVFTVFTQAAGVSTTAYAYTSSDWATLRTFELYVTGVAADDVKLYSLMLELKRNGD